MGIVCLAGIFAVFLLLAWTLCRAAGWEKEREDLEQEQYLKEWRGVIFNTVFHKIWGL